ncbi:MAG TPA: hypothetical protein VJ912_00295 [Candidatus Nanoarchaeia archaeon]|nr:hypothetical protein [Candidatus Nanoarchaeia archaeon]
MANKKKYLKTTDKFKEDKKNPAKNKGKQMKKISGNGKKPHNEKKKPKNIY